MRGVETVDGETVAEMSWHLLRTGNSLLTEVVLVIILLHFT